MDWGYHVVGIFLFHIGVPGTKKTGIRSHCKLNRLRFSRRITILGLRMWVISRAVPSLKDKSCVGTSRHREKHMNRIKFLPFSSMASIPRLWGKRSEGLAFLTAHTVPWWAFRGYSRERDLERMVNPFLWAQHMKALFLKTCLEEISPHYCFDFS